jgi:hypothetical protein
MTFIKGSGSAALRNTPTTWRLQARFDAAGDPRVLWYRSSSLSHLLAVYIISTSSATEICENDLMPAKPGRDEEVFIRLFVSAYENFAWAGSKIDALDEELDGAIEALITRADGQTMAIEPTLIEPFVGDKRDYAMFEQAFLRIEDDKSLAVPDTGTTIYVPVGILDGQKEAKRNIIVKSIHSWIADNRLHLREGTHEYQCDVPGIPPVTLTVKRHKFGLPRPNPGSVLVRRQQVTNDLDKVIDKALRTKLKKLVDTKADRLLLFLERDQFTFHPDLIFIAIARQRGPQHHESRHLVNHEPRQ